MLKFLIISRSQPGQTRERFFYEWAFIHVSLMLHTPPSMRRFRRYVQHFANPDIGDGYRVLPAPSMAWESYAEHWIERFDPTVSGPEYTEQMQPHKFSDSAMEIVYVEGEPVWSRPGFRSGGIKVIHRLARRADLDEASFQRAWREQHLPLLLAQLRDRGLRKVEINLPHRFDADSFHASRRGTLFEKADIDPAAGFEELWFDSLEDALRLGTDRALHDTLRASYESFCDLSRCYSMIANERVVYDYVSETERSPLSTQRPPSPPHPPHWSAQQPPDLSSSPPGQDSPA